MNITDIIDNAVDKLRDAAFDTNDERKAAAYAEAADDLEDARSGDQAAAGTTGGAVMARDTEELRKDLYRFYCTQAPDRLRGDDIREVHLKVSRDRLRESLQLWAESSVSGQRRQAARRLLKRLDDLEEI